MKIEVNDVSKKFKKQDLFSGVNLEFESGKIYGLVGTNGSGKTVLLKIICGLMKPTNGEVLYNGEALGKKIKVLPNCGVLIDRPYFFEELSGYENLEVLSLIKGVIGREEILATLDLVDLENDRKPVSKYSLGMKQRLGIAQAIMEDPDILMLDEVTNGLDDEITPIIHELLLNMAKKNKVVIITSHNKNEIDSLCDEVYRVKKGVVHREK